MAATPAHTSRPRDAAHNKRVEHVDDDQDPWTIGRESDPILGIHAVRYILILVRFPPRHFVLVGAAGSPRMMDREAHAVGPFVGT
jgi:hypothetical protein